MFDPDKLNGFLKITAATLADAVAKGNAKSFDAFFQKLNQAGVATNREERRVKNSFKPPIDFGVKDFERQMALVERAFDKSMSRMFGVFGKLFNSLDVGQKIQKYVQLKNRKTIQQETIDKLSNSSDITKSLNNAAKAHKKALGNAITDENVNAANEKYAKRVDDINKKLEYRKKLLKDIQKLQGDTEAETKQAGRAALGAVAKNVAIAAAGGLALSIIDSYGELRNRGQGGTQALGNIADIQKIRLQLAARGVGATGVDVAKNFGQVGNMLGTVNSPEGLVKNATFLTEHLRLSVEQAGNLSNVFYRSSGYSEKIADETINIAENMAKKNFFPVVTLMRDIANDSELWARHSSQGVEAFARGEMLARRMSTSLKSMDSFGDKLVGDFEGSLKMQAQIQTYWQDFDFSEIMFASQFGSTEDITRALKTQLKGRDISKEPRSFQMALQSGLGLSYTELLGLSGKGNPLGDVAKGGASKEFGVGAAVATTTADFVSNNAEAIKRLAELAWAARGAAIALGLMGVSIPGILGGSIARSAGVGVLGSAAGGAFQAAQQWSAAKDAGHGTLGAVGQTGASLAGTIVGGLGGRYIGGLIGAAMGSVVPGAGTVVGATLGSLAGGYLTGKGLDWVFNGVDKHHSGLLPNEFPSILQRGEAVLTAQHQNNIARVTSVATEAARAGELMNKQPNAMAAMYGGNTDTSNLENLMRQLIGHVKAGQVIHMDGKKVGEIIVNSFSRE